MGDEGESLMELWRQLRFYGYSKVPEGYDEDFASYAVLKHIEGGKKSIFFHTTYVDYMRDTFGDTRSMAGQLSSNETLWGTKNFFTGYDDAGQPIYIDSSCLRSADARMEFEDYMLKAPPPVPHVPWTSEQRVPCHKCKKNFVRPYLKKHVVKCNGAPLSRAPKKRRK